MQKNCIYANLVLSYLKVLFSLTNFWIKCSKRSSIIFLVLFPPSLIKCFNVKLILEIADKSIFFDKILIRKGIIFCRKLIDLLFSFIKL